jgi:hypothetical protein
MLAKHPQETVENKATIKKMVEVCHLLYHAMASQRDLCIAVRVLA